MSQLEVDKVIPQSGTTLTLGESGDTVSIPSGATFTPTLTAPIIDEINDNNGNEEIIFTTTTSAVNELTIANAATGNAPEIAATGDDTDIDLKLTPKGAGNLVLDGIEFPNADGSANQVLQTNGSGVLSFATPVAGITEADQWRITANLVGSSGVITANWERVDTDSGGIIGTGMTESSGVFSFPSTGIYLVNISSFVTAASARLYTGIYIVVSTDNFSTNSVATESFGSVYNTDAYAQLSGSFLLDVTSTANTKVRFEIAASGTSTYEGNTTVNRLHATFTRLGDT